MDAIQTFSFQNLPVSFRNDGYLNATAIAAHFGKQPRDYLKTQPTQEYISTLAESLSIKSKTLIDKNQLVIVKNGGYNRGTWLHPKLAIHFARWLNPRFAVWCDEQIEQIMLGNKPTKSILSTVDDRKPLKDAVVLLAKQKNISFPIAWKMVHHQFNVRTVEELTKEQVEKAIYYIQALSVDNALYGEVLDKVEEPKPIIQSSLSRHYFTLLAKMVGYAKEYADIQKLLCEDYDSPKAQQYRSLISAATTPDTKGFLFVFRPNIREDVQQAAALLYQQSAYL